MCRIISNKFWIVYPRLEGRPRISPPENDDKNGIKTGKSTQALPWLEYVRDPGRQNPPLTITGISHQTHWHWHISWMASTLSEYIQSQEDLVREAALALPHQFSKCTYSLGPLRYVYFSTSYINELERHSTSFGTDKRFTFALHAPKLVVSALHVRLRAIHIMNRWNCELRFISEKSCHRFNFLQISQKKLPLRLRHRGHCTFLFLKPESWTWKYFEPILSKLQSLFL